MIEPATESRPTAFDRAAKAVGHLDHPLYDDEHRRDVWNEASAVGFQALTWGLMLLGTAAVWFGGPAAEPWALGLFLVAGAAGVLVVAYAARRGVEVVWKSPGSSGWVRLALLVVVGLVLVTGVIRNSTAGSELADVLGGLAGGIVGATGMVALIALVVRRARRRAPQGED